MTLCHAPPAKISFFFLFLIECTGTWRVETAKEKRKKKKKIQKKIQIFWFQFLVSTGSVN